MALVEVKTMNEQGDECARPPFSRSKEYIRTCSLFYRHRHLNLVEISRYGDAERYNPDGSPSTLSVS